MFGFLRPFPNAKPLAVGEARWHPLLVAGMIGCWASVSCQSTGVAQQQRGVTAPYQAGHWTRVSAKPPVYYPRGVAAAAPSGAMDGEWYRVCDAADTRYFIPFRLPPGYNRKSLVGEVCSLRTEDYRLQMAKEDHEESAENLKRAAKSAPVLVPLNIGLGLGGALGGCPVFVTPEEYEQWLHNWKKKYGGDRKYSEP